MSPSGLDLVMPSFLETLPGLIVGGIPFIAAGAIALRNGGPVWLALLLALVAGWVGLALVAVYYYAPGAHTSRSQPDESETRLRTLDRLLAEGLIDRVEYERKRHEVLEQL